MCPGTDMPTYMPMHMSMRSGAGRPNAALRHVRRLAFDGTSVSQSPGCDVRYQHRPRRHVQSTWIDMPILDVPYAQCWTRWRMRYGAVDHTHHLVFAVVLMVQRVYTRGLTLRD